MGALEPPVVAAAEAYLQPGQLMVAVQPRRIVTILGSCVAVCLYDPRLRVGGSSHHLLPYWAGDGHRSARFGNVAVERLVEEMAHAGCRRTDLVAKVFGGACVLDAFQETSRHLGAKNVDAALLALGAAGVAVVAQDTGGRRGRRLVFDSASGEALLRLL
jgi:chemotaxis protein CheD